MNRKLNELRDLFERFVARADEYEIEAASETFAAWLTTHEQLEAPAEQDVWLSAMIKSLQRYAE